jgi:hypothetical protein
LPWNLVESLSGGTSPRRAFYAPLASIPPSSTTIRTVFPSAFTPSADTLASGDKVLNVRIAQPFSPEGELPDPAMRLHAMAPGTVRFEPADATMLDRLILEMPMFLTPLNVPWWERWMDADCLPYQIIYENVDRAELQARIESIPLVTPAPLHGLSLPAEIVLPTQRDTFVQNFMSGSPNHQLAAESGAVIGVAGPDPAGGSDRVLKLRARYHGHTDASPRFMNPGEFLNLLFGDDSNDSRHHPLLLRIDGVGLVQPGLESKTMRLRPPLRTHERVMWESRIEIFSHPADWALAGRCGDRFYNDHAREGRAFNHTDYHGLWKCNLFISDIALRSGFRCCIHDVGNTAWHYNGAGTYADNVHNSGNANARIPLRGKIDTLRGVTWGFKFEQWLRAIPVADRIRRVNDLMTDDGRCLVLAGSRAVGSGHIVLIKSVGATLQLTATAGNGIDRIEVTTREASRGGGDIRTGTFKLAGTGGAADSLSNFTRLHLFELHPGQDPDTPAGLRNCNVQT